MAKNFYAIRKGFDVKKNKVIENVIKTSWKDAAPLVQGITKKKHGITPEYEGFMIKKEAEDYLNQSDPLLRKEDGLYPKNCIHCYIDGSFDDNAANYSYGLVCVLNNKILHYEKGLGKNKEAISMRQIGGELLGAINAMLYAKNNNCQQVVIFLDYKGVCYHALDYWKRDKPFSEIYYQWVQKFMRDNANIKIIFCKVDAHTSDDFNELADGFAKIAINLRPNPIFFEMVKKHNLRIFTVEEFIEKYNLTQQKFEEEIKNSKYDKINGFYKVQLDDKYCIKYYPGASIIEVIE